MKTVHIIAISKKGMSRIGRELTTGVVELEYHDKMFIVLHHLNQRRWIKVQNDPDYRIIPDD